MFDRVVDDLDCNKVTADDLGGAYLATEHLIGNGCRKIALITTPDYVVVGNDRREGYLKALNAHGIEEDENRILKVDHEMEIDAPLRSLLESENPPDGIFAVNEVYAATAMKTIRECGLEIPYDIEVIGFTDGLISEYTVPALTTIAQHGRSMGKKALELLLDEIDSQDLDYKHKTSLIKTDLKIRNSTKKVSQTT